MSSLPGVGPSRGPQPFGKYLLDGLIAEGGMARVYRARLRGALGFEKPLVVKLVRPELSRDPRFVAMFAEEAKTLVRLSHPHIVSVYELGVVDGTYFLAMDQVDGATLAALLRDGALAPPLAARLGEQVAEALHHAHERFGLVHRDVTPRNVLVDLEGHARLVDFGIATPAEGASGEVFGSHGYMAPEQLRGEPVDARVDIFALGAVLHQALCGEPAFLPSSGRGAMRPAEVAREAILAGEIPELPEDVPELLRALVRECLAHRKEDRPRSAAEVARRLRTWLAVAAPEGAGDELRARVALVAREHGDVQEGPVTVTSRKGLATSLATAELLTAALGPEGAEAGEANAFEGGTVPLTGRGRGAEPSGSPSVDPAARPRGVDASGPSGGPGVGPDESAGPRASEGRSSDPGTNARSSERSTGVASEGEPHRESRSEGSTDATLGWAGRGGAAAGVEGASDSPRAATSAPWKAVGVALALASFVGLGWLVGRGAFDPTPNDEPATATAPALREATRIDPVEQTTTPRPELVEAAPTAPTTPSAEEADVSAEATSSRGTLTVHATPWAEVSLDGRSLGTTPLRRVSLAPGTHTLVFDNPPLGRSLRVPVRVEAGGTLRVIADLDADPPRARVR